MRGDGAGRRGQEVTRRRWHKWQTHPRRVMSRGAIKAPAVFDPISQAKLGGGGGGRRGGKRRKTEHVTCVLVCVTACACVHTCVLCDTRVPARASVCTAPAGGRAPRAALRGGGDGFAALGWFYFCLWLSAGSLGAAAVTHAGSPAPGEVWEGCRAPLCRRLALPPPARRRRGPWDHRGVQAWQPRRAAGHVGKDLGLWASVAVPYAAKDNFK